MQIPAGEFRTFDHPLIPPHTAGQLVKFTFETTSASQVSHVAEGSGIRGIRGQ